MNQEQTGAPPLTPQLGVQEQSTPRPPCAVDLSSALGLLATVKHSSDQEQVEEVFDAANFVFIGSIEKAKAATQADCNNCLEGREINCPLKEVPVESSSQLRELRKLTAVPTRRIKKLLLTGGLSGPTPIDQSLANELSALGFRQNSAREIKTPVLETPLENTVQDPRAPEAKERDRLEDHKESRPDCAHQLSAFIKERNAARRRWKKKNIGRPAEEWTTFKGTESLRIYSRALDAAEGVNPEECKRCLDEFCPLKNDVGAVEFYDTTRVEIALHDGSRARLLPRIENILDGLPWSEIMGPPDPTITALEIVEILQGLVVNTAKKVR